MESEKQPSSALLAEQGASTCTITALQVVASLLGHVRLSTARLFWQYDSVQGQPGCMVCREILQRPLAGFMKYTPENFSPSSKGPGESQGAPQARKASFPPRFGYHVHLLAQPINCQNPDS